MKALVLRMVQNELGAAIDNEIRASLSFKHMSETELDVQHGQSNRTRRAIWDGYKAAVAEKQACLDWVQKQN